MSALAGVSREGEEVEDIQGWIEDFTAAAEADDFGHILRLSGRDPVFLEDTAHQGRRCLDAYVRTVVFLASFRRLDDAEARLRDFLSHQSYGLGGAEAGTRYTLTIGGEFSVALHIDDLSEVDLEDLASVIWYGDVCVDAHAEVLDDAAVEVLRELVESDLTYGGDEVTLTTHVYQGGVQFEITWGDGW